MSYRLSIAGKTDRGRRRAKNEDCLSLDKDLGFMLVADGMGGHASGEVASKLASEICTEQLRRALKTGRVPVPTHVPANGRLDPRTLLLGDCVKMANRAVFEAAQNDPTKHNMGTTLVAALWLDDKLAVCNVGDSRLYVSKVGRLTQVTVDHSFVQEQVERGLMKAEDAEKSELRNMLTRSVGIDEDVDVDVMEAQLSPGDFVLLCSDGLTKMLNDREIEKVFQEKNDPAEIVSELIRRANQAGGADNITCAVGRLEGSPATWAPLADRVKAMFRKKVETQ
ncbi:MAG: Stp1/IreP family PP2C-type Ser/Thr phosphatase [Elusimicrobia bacterium]|nr:Stp1/IreP family PP2C-type Ser/Thr phosphatase [Elusimicrobiota bacterium]